MRAIALVFLIAALPAAADVLTVLPDGTGDYPTIQDALAVVQDGDTVALGDGVFAGPGNGDLWEWIEFPAYSGAFTIRSLSGDPEACIVDGEGTGEFYVDGRMTLLVQGVQFRDVTVYTGDMGPAPNPPIDLRITDCRFLRTAVTLWLAAEADVTDCTFTESRIAAIAGMRLAGCRFDGSHSDGNPAVFTAGWLTVEDCAFTGTASDTRGGAIYLDCAWDVPWIEIATTIFDGCSAAQSGGAIALTPAVNAQPADMVVTGCTFHACDAPLGSAVVSEGLVTMERCLVVGGTGGTDALACLEDGAFALACCDLFGNAGGDWVGCVAGQEAADGNFSADPCFCDASGGDLALCADSPCLPGQHPWGCGALVGALGQGCGACGCPGPVATEPHSWSTVKSLFR